jgi:hypothetical protein
VAHFARQSLLRERLLNEGHIRRQKGMLRKGPSSMIYGKSPLGGLEIQVLSAGGVDQTKSLSK